MRGESITIGDYIVTVKETDGRRVLLVNFKKQVDPVGKD